MSSLIVESLICFRSFPKGRRLITYVYPLLLVTREHDANGEKYCAVSVISKYLGYDIAAESKKIQNDNNTNPTESIPCAILEMIENFTVYGNPKKNLNCFCKRPYYYYYTLISLLIHLNDYHKMTFTQIGNWLESKDM